MTERLKGVYVAFNEDYREDDAEQILAAIRMFVVEREKTSLLGFASGTEIRRRRIRGVADVEPMVADSTDWIARVRVKAELTDKIWDALQMRMK